MEQTDTLIGQGEGEIKKGLWDSGSKLFGQVIDILEGTDMDDAAKRKMSKVLRLKAFADSRKGDYKAAVQCATRALDISRSISDQEGEADALRRLGYIHWQRSDYPMSMEFYNNALEKAEACCASLLVGRTKIELGNVFNSMREGPKAVRAYLDAADILKKEKDLNELARTYSNLGSCYLNMKKFEDAIEVLKMSMSVAEEAGDITVRCWASFNLAECLVKMGRPEDSFQYLDPIIPIFEKSDDRVGMAVTYLNYGMAHAALQQWERAEGSYNRSMKIVKELAMPSLEGEIYEELGKMYLAMGETERAKEKLAQALEIYNGADLKPEAENIKALFDGM